MKLKLLGFFFFFRFRDLRLQTDVFLVRPLYKSMFKKEKRKKKTLQDMIAYFN